MCLSSGSLMTYSMAACQFGRQAADDWAGHARGRMMAEARNNAHREVLGENARIAPCPACGQHNAKADNNNHMRCWACNVRIPAPQVV